VGGAGEARRTRAVPLRVVVGRHLPGVLDVYMPAGPAGQQVEGDAAAPGADPGGRRELVELQPALLERLGPASAEVAVDLHALRVVAVDVTDEVPHAEHAGVAEFLQ